MFDTLNIAKDILIVIMIINEVNVIKCVVKTGADAKNQEVYSNRKSIIFDSNEPAYPSTFSNLLIQFFNTELYFNGKSLTNYSF
jgi:hypothetical protein